MRHGKGHEYFENNKYQVEYYKGKRNGKYKVTNDDGEIIKEGEYLNGEKTGKWKEVYDNGLIFEGEYSNDMKNGKGKEYYKNGEIEFEGEYKNGNRCYEGNVEYIEDNYYEYDNEYE